MAGRAPCFLFKQTRVNLDWSDRTPTTHTEVHLPRHPSSRSARSLILRSKPKSREPSDSEEAFKLAQHATLASVYHRPAVRFPRCILWRIVEDWTVLTLSAVDFTKPDAGSELGRTLRFVFPEQLQPGGVGFADARGHDEMVVYALTTGGVLYTLRLNQSFFLEGSRKKELNPKEFCQVYAPSGFLVSRPHFLLPVNDESVIVSLRDGSILRLQRLPTLEGSITARYNEKSFSESSYWNYFKQKMPWVGATTVPYGDHSVYHTTVVSGLAYHPPANYMNAMDYRSNMQSLLFTVSVDHTLKVWSLEKETLLLSTDLLNEQHSNSKMGTWLDPTPSRLLTVVDRSFQDNHMFYLVSFSSATTGRFKFWAATHDNGEFTDLVDLYPDHSFEATPPGGTAPWIISEFRITPSPSKETVFDLWVLWKSDTNFRIQNLQFDFTDIPSRWGQWATATLDSSHEIPSGQSALETVEEVTDQWMKWIFYPGRFPDTVLESALVIYELNFSTPDENAPKNESIEAKVVRTIGESVTLDTDVTGQPDYEKYRTELELQWERFGRLCQELDKDRGEALSLVTDPVSGYVWTVNVDGITALRECTESEVIKHNYVVTGDDEAINTLSVRTPRKLGAGLQGQGLKDVLLLATCGSELYNSLSEEAQEKARRRLHDEVTKEQLFSLGDMMEGIYDACLYGEVPDEIYDRIDVLFHQMSDQSVAFQSILSSLFHADVFSGGTRLTAFGSKVLVSGSQEVVQVNYELLFNLVLLLLHVCFCDEVPFHRLNNTSEIFKQLIGYFREYEILKWMAMTTSPLTPRAENDISGALTSLRVTDGCSDRPEKRGSVLQLVLPEVFGPSASGPGRSGFVTLSMCIRRFLSGLELTDSGNGITDVATSLLNVGASAAAHDFMKFLPTTVWGTYMKGRVELASGNYDEAARFFHRAAFGMAKAERANYLDTPIFRSDAEREYAVGGGAARYALHAATLFEGAGASEAVIDFCNTALLSGAETTENLKSEILGKQFQAALRTKRWDEAYTALTAYPNRPLQRAGIRELVTAMVENNEGARLIGYPFIGLQDEVDDALEYKCSQIVDVANGPAFHKVLYAWRIQRGDYRGAAAVLYERLQKLQTANVGSTDPNSRTVTDGYLALINVLSCVDEQQAWILSTQREEVESTGGGTGGAKRVRLGDGEAKVSSAQRRKVLTLGDIRNGYQTEVERVGLLLNGGFFV